MRPHWDSCRYRCRKLPLLPPLLPALLFRGWLCGIPEWNNSQSESHNMAARPTPKAWRTAICLLCRISLAALPTVPSSSAAARAAGASAASSGIPLPRECHSNSLLRFIFPLLGWQAGGWAAERHIDYAFDSEAVASWGRGSSWGWGWAWGECKSTAIVARVCARK